VGLDFRQLLFVEAFLGQANGNASEAARIAGYPHAKQAGSRLLSNVDVRAKLDQRLASAAMPANEVLARLTEIASGDLGEYIKVDGRDFHVDVRKVKRSGRVVRKIKATKYGTELELHSPADALKTLARCHGLYKADSQSHADLDAELDDALEPPAEGGSGAGEVPG
jgi:hypothetical protein